MKYPEEIKTSTYQSEYGNYIEHYYANKQNYYMVSPNYTAFVKNGNSLYLIHYDHSPDLVVGPLTIDFKIADDFQIILFLDDVWDLYDKYNYIYIKNNGILYQYYISEIKNNTSVNSRKGEEKEDGATYSLDGKKVQTPHNGIFIKGDKKVIIK